MATDNQHVRSPCSIGWPVPKSVANDNATVSSAKRPVGAASATVTTLAKPGRR